MERKLDGPTIREHYSLAERVTRIEADVIVTKEKVERVSEAQRRLVWIVITAVLIAVLKGVAVSQ